MLFDGDGLTYRDLKSMDMAEYYECIAAKKMFVQQLKEQRQTAAAYPSGCSLEQTPHPWTN